MALWRCDLRVSWRSQLISLGSYGGVMLLILLAPWPAGYWPAWMTLLLLVLFECIRSQRRITARTGEVILLDEERLLWRGHEWQLRHPVWMVSHGALLSLRREKRKGVLAQAMRSSRQRLWLASDSMSVEEWRRLRQILLNSRPPGPEKPG
ncbi:protein YgfX [Rahnella inusitata]|uniref:protein YgfX n=1 Tax=Rahnella inusitata TaxID=58169 RepID=UPI0039BE9E15